MSSFDELWNTTAASPTTTETLPTTKASSFDAMWDTTASPPSAPKESVSEKPVEKPPSGFDALWSHVKQFGSDMVQGAQYLAGKPPQIPRQTPLEQSPPTTPAAPAPPVTAQTPPAPAPPVKPDSEYRFPQWHTDYDFNLDPQHRIGQDPPPGQKDPVTGFYFNPPSRDALQPGSGWFFEHDPRFASDEDEQKNKPISEQPAPAQPFVPGGQFGTISPDIAAKVPQIIGEKVGAVARNLPAIASSAVKGGMQGYAELAKAVPKVAAGVAYGGFGVPTQPEQMKTFSKELSDQLGIDQASDFWKLKPDEQKGLQASGALGKALSMAGTMVLQLPEYIASGGVLKAGVDGLIKKVGVEALQKALPTISKIYGGDVAKGVSDIATNVATMTAVPTAQTAAGQGVAAAAKELPNVLAQAVPFGAAGSVLPKGLKGKVEGVEPAVSGVETDILKNAPAKPIEVPGAAAEAKPDVTKPVNEIKFDDYQKLPPDQQQKVYEANPVNGVPGQRAFNRVLDERTENFKKPITVAAVDANGLKAVNDGLSPAHGDKYIKDTYNALASTMPNENVFNPHGDEYFIVGDPGETPDQLAQRIKSAAELRATQKITIKGKIYKPTITAIVTTIKSPEEFGTLNPHEIQKNTISVDNSAGKLYIINGVDGIEDGEILRRSPEDEKSISAPERQAVVQPNASPSGIQRAPEGGGDISQKTAPGEEGGASTLKSQSEVADVTATDLRQVAQRAARLLNSSKVQAPEDRSALEGVIQAVTRISRRNAGRETGEAPVLESAKAANVDRNVPSEKQPSTSNEPTGPDVVAGEQPRGGAGDAEKGPPVGEEVPPQEHAPNEPSTEPQAAPAAEVKLPEEPPDEPPQEPPAVPPEKGAEPQPAPPAPDKEPPPEPAAAPQEPTEPPPKKGLAGEAGAVDVSGVKEYLDKSREQLKYSGDLEGDYYKLLGANESDKIKIRDILKKNDISLKDQEAIYHWIENPKEAIAPEQEKMYHDVIEPIMDESNQIYSKLRTDGYPVSKEGHVTRNAQDRGGWMDRLASGAKDIISSGPLRKTTGSMKHRVMMSATDDLENKKVVAVKNGKITAWENGKPTEMGNVNLKTKESLLDKELEPLEKQQKRLETEITILNKRKGADVRKENIKNQLEDISHKIDDIYQGYDPNELNDKVFTDAGGTQWKLGQATTKEIEQHSGVKYHKTLLLNELVNLQKLRMADRATQYLENLKTDPEFSKMAIKVGTKNLPEDYKPTNLPQLKGYAFPTRVSETLDTFYKNADKGLMSPDNLYSKVNSVLRNAIFFNPFMHVPNIAVHAVVNRGVSPLAIPSRYIDLIKSSRKAIEATLTMNKDYQTALEKGAGLLYSKQVNKDLFKLMLDKSTQELKDKPVLAGAIGKALGYANPIKLIKGVYALSGRTTWAFNDIATLQAMYEEMGHGKPMEEAIADVAKHIPNYRIPARVLNSTAISKLMKSENGVTMFGAYHYGALKSYGEMAKSLLGKVPIKERAEAADKLAMMALVGFFVYPQLDNLAKMATGKKTSKFRRAGAITFSYKTQQLATGKIEFSDWLQSVMTPSVGLQLGTELLSGHDWRSGAKLPIKEAALRSVSPLGYGEKLEKGQVTPKDYALSLIGISSPKFDLDKASSAEVKAYKLAMSHIPQKERSKEQIGKSNAKNKIVEQYAKNKNVNVLNQAVKDKTITKADRTNILKGATETPLEKYSERLSYDEVKSIIDDRRTSPEEKQQLENMPSFYIKTKIKQLAEMEPGSKDRGKIVEDVRKKIMERAQKVREMPQGEEKAAAVRRLKTMETMFKKGMKGTFEDDRAEAETKKPKQFSIRNQADEPEN